MVGIYSTLFAFIGDLSALRGVDHDRDASAVLFTKTIFVSTIFALEIIPAAIVLRLLLSRLAIALSQTLLVFLYLWTALYGLVVAAALAATVGVTIFVGVGFLFAADLIGWLDSPWALLLSIPAAGAFMYFLIHSLVYVGPGLLRGITVLSMPRAIASTFFALGLGGIPFVLLTIRLLDQPQ